MVALAIVCVVGFAAVLRSPDLVDIPSFTTIFTTRGLSRVNLIWALLIFPTVLAFVAAGWLFLGAKGQAFPLFFG